MLRLMATLLLLTASVCAQTPDARQLASEFGPAFKPEVSFPVLTGDLYGEGKEDAVVVATVENPLLDQAEFHYKVVDPYNTFFGFGDPTVTSKFSAQELHPRVLLVVHNWRQPLQKFVIINLPVEKVSLARVLVKKKVFPAIRAEDVTGTKSYVYWDRKQWRWQEDAAE